MDTKQEAVTGEGAVSRVMYRIYYRRNGKRYYDNIPGKDLVDAQRKFLNCANEMGWKVEIEV